MNLRTKTVGLVAAFALSLSLTGGIAAAQTTTTTLTAPGTGVGACVLTVANGQNVSFGTYRWDGSAYVYQEGTTDGSITANLSHTGSPGKRHCNAIQASGTDLTQGTDIAFLASQINVGTAVGIGTAKDAAPGQDIALGATVPVNLPVSVTGVPLSTAPIGEYFGTITLTLASGT